MDSKILIIDDAAFARKFMRRILENNNYSNIIEATTAAQALEAFQENAPDLVFLDISLPDCSDLSLLDKLLQINPNAFIIMCSALGQPLIIADAIKKGARDFLVKPYEEKHLLRIVENALS